MIKLEHRLKNKIKEKGVSAYAIAHAAGIPVSSLKNILQGKVRSPQARTLEKLASALGCSIADLIISDEASNVVTLIGNSDNEPVFGKRIDQDGTPFNAELYIDIITAMGALVKKNARFASITPKQIFNATNEIYDYLVLSAKHRNSPTITVDPVFVEWILNKVIPE